MNVSYSTDISCTTYENFRCTWSHSLATCTRKNLVRTYTRSRFCKHMHSTKHSNQMHSFKTLRTHALVQNSVSTCNYSKPASRCTRSRLHTPGVVRTLSMMVMICPSSSVSSSAFSASYGKSTRARSTATTKPRYNTTQHIHALLVPMKLHATHS